MDKLVEYQSSKEESSEGLCESDGVDNPTTSGPSINIECPGANNMDLTSVNAPSEVLEINLRKDHPKAESSSDTLPEEGEIVTKPVSSEKTTEARKGKLKRRGLAVVAFSAYMRACKEPLIDDVISFEKVTMNYGRGYKRHFSTFVCPRSGTYLITWRVVLIEVREVTLNLMVNGEVRRRTTFDCVDSSDNKRCEREAIIKLSMRDRVCLTLYNGDRRILRPTKCKFAGIRLMR